MKQVTKRSKQVTEARTKRRQLWKQVTTQGSNGCAVIVGGG